VRAEIPLLVGIDYRLKRCLDYVGALVGVVVLLPVFISVAIAIKVSSPGPIFFRQQRVGLQGKTFRIWKFRTMVVGAPQLQAQLEIANETSDGVMFKLKHDPRLISVGTFLRRTSLDEIPQLFNVLTGEMSLVGPRPLPLRDVEHFDAWHHIRHQVMPGITGLWQISGRSNIQSFNDVARLDLYYIDNWSLNLDWDILVETVKILLFRQGAY
jgi:exopolysaccharide biosynthesis polyprenyl glycosylphosphotransferase